MPTARSADLAERLLAGNEGALARALTLVEREAPEAGQILSRAYPHTGRAWTIGITGPPGAGKSTLTDALTRHLRARDQSVGIVAVDPTSPFSGGAVLGDRIRMQSHYLDPGVFIRSMATRGSQGGLPATCQAAVRLLDASGRNVILVETVGVGQTELDIMGTADTVCVVLVPEAGDTIQTMKAGLLEIADLLVVNKADRDGAHKLTNELKNMLHLAPPLGYWEVPALQTVAVKDQGVGELLAAMDSQRAALEGSGEQQKRRDARRRSELVNAIEQRLKARLWQAVEGDGHLSGAIARVRSGETDPYSAAEAILGDRDLLHAWLSQVADGRHSDS